MGEMVDLIEKGLARVEQELELPEDIYGHDIEGNILEDFGFSTGPDMFTKSMAALSIHAYRYDGEFLASITHDPTQDPMGPIETLGGVWINDSVGRENILPIANKWVRSSGSALWVAARVGELAMPKGMRDSQAHGVTLVSATDLSSEFTNTQTKAQMA